MFPVSLLSVLNVLKVEDHDTHQTDDITSALASVLPGIRASIPLLNAEKAKQVQVTHSLISFVGEVTNLGNKILNNAEKARDELISNVMRNYTKIEEVETNFVQSIKKETSLTEADTNSSISSINSMSSWINVLADVAEGPAVLFEVRNERLQDRVTALLRECKESRRKLHSSANFKPRFK